MEIEILVSRQCRTCEKEVALWRALCAERGIAFRVLDAEQGRGRELAERLDLLVLPALLVEGELRAVGVQTRDQAESLLAGAGA